MLKAFMGLAVVGCIYGLAGSNTSNTQDIMVLNSLLTAAPATTTTVAKYRDGNIALNKPARISSPHSPAENAVDGNFNNFAHNSDAGDVVPWWVVDL